MGMPPEVSAWVEPTLAQRFPWLVFPQGLEQRFLMDAQDRRFLVILGSGLASVLLFAGVLIADALLMPDILGLCMALRLGVYAPVVLIGLFVLHRWRRPLLTEWMVTVTGIMATLLSTVMYTTSTSPWALSASVALNIVVVYGCAFARFWPAVVLSAVVLLAQAYLVWTLPDASGVVASNASLVMAFTMVFTLYGNYKLEFDERLAYLLDLREKALNAQSQAAHARLAALATTDSLTSVSNRRCFDEFLHECLARARQQGGALSLAMIDIDDFKRYNDQHGHQAGDQCLIAVAQAISGCTRRPGDLVARLGGEEFAVVMCDTDAPAAAAAGERIRLAVEALGLTHATSSCAKVVTVSVGVSSVGASADMSAIDLCLQADASLYAAKSSGRNRVSCSAATAAALGASQVAQGEVPL
jgi:diguanylate cyclase (GGDEF)-like protein